jgi:hypothetical protein
LSCTPSQYAGFQYRNEAGGLLDGNL